MIKTSGFGTFPVSKNYIMIFGSQSMGCYLYDHTEQEFPKSKKIKNAHEIVVESLDTMSL